MSTVTRQTPDSDPTVTRDELFDILSSHRRRYAIHAIKQNEGEAELSDLAEQVAAWENEKPLTKLTADERHCVYTSLQQTHLPAMDRAGVIEFERGTAVMTDQAAALDVYIDVVPEDSIPWGEYYLGLSIVSIGLVSAGVVGILPSEVSTPMWMGLIVMLFSFSAMYHTWQSRKYQLGNDSSPPEVNL